MYSGFGQAVAVPAPGGNRRAGSPSRATPPQPRPSPPDVELAGFGNAPPRRRALGHTLVGAVGLTVLVLATLSAFTGGVGSAVAAVGSAFGRLRGPRPPPVSGPLPWADDEGFVTTAGTAFMHQCRPFYVSGFNAHDLLPKAMADVRTHRMVSGRSGRALIASMFANATRSYGLNTVRLFAGTTDPAHRVLDGKGTYANEDALVALDFILDTARASGLKVILSLLDNWKAGGGVDEVVDWSPTAPKRTHRRKKDGAGDFDGGALSASARAYEAARHALFFSDPGSRDIYRRWAGILLSRTNSLNGRRYGEDPTILAWNLLNEPRCETGVVPECAAALPAWVEEMAALVKAGTRSLVTIGEEGFFGGADPRNASNPGDWGPGTGQDFGRDHGLGGVDFATVHLWPDNWDKETGSWGVDWLDAHAAAAADLGKPVLLQVFGKALPASKTPGAWGRGVKGGRDPLFKGVYAWATAQLEGVNTSAVRTAPSPLAGAAFWRWDVGVYAGVKPTDYGVGDGDSSTFAIVSAAGARSAALTAALAPSRGEGCPAGCWVPVPASAGKAKGACVDSPATCGLDGDAALEASDRRAVVAAADAGVRVYGSRAACCRPGLGAFVNGCKGDVGVPMPA